MEISAATFDYVRTLICDQAGIILDRVQRVLRSDGYLFLGSAETTMGIHDGYTRQPWGKTGYYRLSGGAAERNGGR